MDTPKTPEKPLLSIQVAILIGCSLIAFAILLSGGVIRLKGYQIPSQPSTTTQAENPAIEDVVQTVSVDDDPVLGDPNAPVTIIEFSDYECPFCKRHFDEVYPKLKKDYIDTGKAKLVFRDLPLDFHDPLATTEAIAATCAKEQGGDKVYFDYHDKVFTNTKSNGDGLTKENLYAFANELNLNADQFRSCLDSEKYKEEVQKDAKDAESVGATGTPTFFIGKSSPDGIIQGTRVIGAQPFTTFESNIKELLP